MTLSKAILNTRIKCIDLTNLVTDLPDATTKPKKAKTTQLTSITNSTAKPKKTMQLTSLTISTNKPQKSRTKHKWPCKKCPEIFELNKQLRQHRKVHRKEDDGDLVFKYKFDSIRKVFVCYSCDVEANSKEKIEKHVLEHQEKFECKVCNKEFLKPFEYSCHLNDHDKSKGYPCPFCEYVSKIRSIIRTHINTFHLKQFIYTCKLCGKGFNASVLYKEHNNVHEGIKPFQCVVCQKDFQFSSYLMSHQVRSHRVTIDGLIGVNQCPICLLSFSRKNTLETHIMKRHPKKEGPKEKKHLCDVCGKGFVRKEKLRVHYRTHTGIKPYKCSYCEKSFTKKEYLIMHERVHSGEKPYSCEYCGKSFNQGAPLRIHIRTHTGERPYKCHLCDNGFISRNVLNSHLKNCPGRTD